MSLESTTSESSKPGSGFFAALQKNVTDKRQALTEWAGKKVKDITNSKPGKAIAAHKKIAIGAIIAAPLAGLSVFGLLLMKHLGVNLDLNTLKNLASRFADTMNGEINGKVYQLVGMISGIGAVTGIIVGVAKHYYDKPKAAKVPVEDPAGSTETERDPPVRNEPPIPPSDTTPSGSGTTG